MHDTLHLLARSNFPRLRRGTITTLQLNLGYRCNQSCLHCHVNAGPNRKEEITDETVDAVIDFLAANAQIISIDLTGGAPELNRNFRRLVVIARARGLRVIDRCNLTILEQPGHEDLAMFLAAHRVEIVASLPCYQEENVDKQRGTGAFERSLKGLRRLNALGYGHADSGLVLNLVYNPQGANLPPAQAALEADYRRYLGGRHGIVFNQLYTLANMPIQRFGSTLISKGQFNTYMTTLRGAHRDENLDQVMCRSMVSVDWQGYMYDCDFNQQLGLALTDDNGSRLHITGASVALLESLPIRVADHCYGCTAGQGSSCGGALEAQTAPARAAAPLAAASHEFSRRHGMSAPGRVCPLRYRYGASAIAVAPERPAEILYVIGGLYGNLQALATVEAMARAETGPVTLCFNGDFNWFNVDDAGFRAINERVLRHDAIVGNVEAELSESSDAAGCGCAYPESVDQGTVERSNWIHARLKRTAARHPDLLGRLGALPMVARYRVGDARIGVVHGDAESLAGWRFDVTALDDPKERTWRAEVFAKADVDIFASTHTCLPAIRRFELGGVKLVANNGAAGMPNARGTRFGILTRIGNTLSPYPSVYGHRAQELHVDALAIHYDDPTWQQCFLENWPEGSPAWLSYFARIAKGPEFSFDRAARLAAV